ncbi:hypothetical protein F6X40_21505 [Paraburkholderia sp. UCT31]|nr:hypothetical protein [Paraburkholderia sp. UCT31]
MLDFVTQASLAPCAHGRPKRLDVCRFSFESAGALALVNEYSGFAVAPAHYIAFAGRCHVRATGCPPDHGPKRIVVVDALT